MEVTVSTTDQVTVFVIRGSVDGLTAERPAADRWPSASARVRSRLVADCSALEYTSSAGLRSLLGAVKLRAQHGGDLRLAAMQPQVLRVLDLSGFTASSSITPTCRARWPVRRATPERPGRTHEVDARHSRGVAVVIGSGSVKCAAVARSRSTSLNRAGIAIDMLVGCSAGLPVRHDDRRADARPPKRRR